MIRDKVSTRERLDFSWLPDSATVPLAHLKKRFASAGAGVSITNGELRLVTGTVNNFTGGARYALRGGQIADNFEVYARAKYLSVQASISLRGSIDGNANRPNRAYLATFSSASYGFTRTITGVDVGLGNAPWSSTLVNGSVINLRIRVQGDLLLMRGWKAGETEPNAWLARVIDTGIPRKGEIGILIQGFNLTNATVGFQDIIVRQLEPLNDDAPVTANLGFGYGGAATLPASVGGHVVRANATSAPFTLTLPPAASVAHETITVKKIAADATTNAVTLAAVGSDTIDGATTYALSTVKGVVTLLSYGTGYDVI